MTDLLPQRIIDGYGFKEAFETAQEHGFGFADDAFLTDEVAGILPPTRDEKGVRQARTVIRPIERSLGFSVLRQEMLHELQQVDPASNLDHAHILQTPSWSGEMDWHRDIVKVDETQIKQDYLRGRFRVGLNLAGIALISYHDPLGNEIDRRIGPGTLYVIDNSHNPLHRSVNQGELASEPRRVLIMTDVVHNA